jgi:hypothetical protein
MALAWSAPGWLPEGWQPESHGDAPPPVAVHRHVTAVGSLDTTIVLAGDLLMARYAALKIQRGEDIRLTVQVENLGGESLAGWPFAFRLLANYDATAPALAEIVSGAGITAVAADTLDVFIPSAATDRAAGRYYLTLARTLPGDRGVLLYGSVDIRKPRAV